MIHVKIAICRWLWPQLWPAIEGTIKQHVCRAFEDSEYQKEARAFMLEMRGGHMDEAKRQKDEKELRLRHHEDLLHALTQITDAIKAR